MRIPVLQVRDLHVTYAGGVRALRGISLDVAAGEAVAIVGESGCGKSTLALAILRLLPGSATVRGAVRVGDVEVYGPGAERDVRALRGRLAGLVIQDPMSSFDPLMRVGAHLIEARQLHARRWPRGERWTWAARALAALQIPDPARRSRQFPHQWSGGMLQRAAIATASANRPPLLLADEPTASLDLPLAVDVMDRLRDQQREHGAALVVITHQIGLAARIADRIGVMYAGRIVELGPTAQVIGAPRHPYTRGLLAAMPRRDGGLPDPLNGELPSLAPPPPGCAFSARCGLAKPSCAIGEPPELIDGCACPVVRS